MQIIEVKVKVFILEMVNYSLIYKLEIFNNLSNTKNLHRIISAGMGWVILCVCVLL